jgi:hypothetical protein
MPCPRRVERLEGPKSIWEDGVGVPEKTLLAVKRGQEPVRRRRRRRDGRAEEEEEEEEEEEDPAAIEGGAGLGFCGWFPFPSYTLVWTLVALPSASSAAV